MAMIKSDKFNTAKKEVIKLLGKENVLTNKTALLLNCFDGSPVKSLPEAVLEIKDISKLPALIAVLNKHKVPFVPRAAATNHDGGAVAIKGGAILNLNHLDAVEDINIKEGYAVVQCSTVNGNLQKILDKEGFFYAPDPASREFSTIGGNCALGAGGPKTLKYGATLANVLGTEFILPDGTEIALSKNSQGPDLLSLLLRSEGTLGLIKKLRLKILPKPSFKRTFLAYFPSLTDAMLCVKEIIAAGIQVRRIACNIHFTGLSVLIPEKLTDDVPSLRRQIGPFQGFQDCGVIALEFFAVGCLCTGQLNGGAGRNHAKLIFLRKVSVTFCQAVIHFRLSDFPVFETAVVNTV